MEIALVLLAVTQGAVLGIVALDFVHRRLDREARAAAKAELEAAQKGLAELHNKNVGDMRALQDKVSAHGMALAQRVQK